MKESHSEASKNEILRQAFSRLGSRIAVSTWTKSSKPYSELRLECEKLISDPAMNQELKSYFQSRTIIRRAVEMFFTYISMSARAKWDDAPASIRPVVARGWFLGRWIPTFLIIDGPIGRFISSYSNKTPLANISTADFPIISSARDFLNEKVFITLRNSFAHWGFDWEVIGKDSYVVAYNWDNDLQIAKLHQEEADAFHIIAYGLIEVLHDEVISQI